jgi:hypothetical protein
MVLLNQKFNPDLHVIFQSTILNTDDTGEE